MLKYAYIRWMALDLGDDAFATLEEEIAYAVEVGFADPKCS